MERLEPVVPPLKPYQLVIPGHAFGVYVATDSKFKLYMWADALAKGTNWKGRLKERP